MCPSNGVGIYACLLFPLYRFLWRYKKGYPNVYTPLLNCQIACRNHFCGLLFFLPNEKTSFFLRIGYFKDILPIKWNCRILVRSVEETGNWCCLTPSYMNRGTKFIHRGKFSLSHLTPFSWSNKDAYHKQLKNSSRICLGLDSHKISASRRAAVNMYT